MEFRHFVQLIAIGLVWPAADGPRGMAPVGVVERRRAEADHRRFPEALDDSFGRDWRNPRTWPWGRMGWAYGFSFAGVTAAVGIGLLISAMVSSSTRAKAPTTHVETWQSFRLVR